MCPQPVGHCLLTSHHSCKWARWPPWEHPWHQAYKPRTTWWHTLHRAHSELWQRSQSQPVRCRSLLQCPQLVCTVVDCWFSCITLGIHASWITWPAKKAVTINPSIHSFTYHIHTMAIYYEFLAISFICIPWKYMRDWLSPKLRSEARAVCCLFHIS
jgi:hypothetical protein